MCFESQRAAQLAGRQKIKVDDIKFACRKNPTYLGKMEESYSKQKVIDKAKKLVDVNDDKIMKSSAKTFEEDDPLNEKDDDVEMETKTTGGRSTGKGSTR